MPTKNVPKFKFDKAFQAKLLRSMYQWPDDTREIILSLEPSMFDTAPMRWVARKLKGCLLDTNVPATSVVLTHEATVDAHSKIIPAEHIDAYATFISSLGSPVPDKTYILDRAWEYVKYVSMQEFVIEAAKMLQNPGSVDWTSLMSGMGDQSRLGTRLEGGLGQDYFTDADERLKRLSKVEKDGIPTGLVIDTKLRHNGLPPRQLGCVIAPPGRGKTALLVYIGGSAILAGKKVLHISLELDEDIIGERYDARFTNIAISNLTKSKPKVKNRLAKVLRDHGGELRLKYFPTGSLTVAGLKTYLTRLESISFYPDLIILDYADNMDLSEWGNGDSDYGTLGKLYKALRGLAGERSIPLWTASQSNRSSMDKKVIGVQDIADSFKKAAEADVMVAISQDESERTRKIARLVIVKNRNGPTGSSHSVMFDTAKVRVDDI